MPFIVTGERAYKSTQKVGKHRGPKPSAPTSPPGTGPGPKKGRSNPIRSKPGDGKK